VSLSGITPLAFHLDHPGPIARCVDDLAIVYRAIAGHDANDCCSQPRADEGLEPSTNGAKPRIGLVGGFFHDRANADVLRVAAQAAEQLRAAGAEVQPIELPDSFAGVVPAHRMIMAVEAAAYHREMIAARRSEYGPRVASLIDEGLAATSADYSGALSLQLRFRRDMERLFAATKFDALAMPAVSNTAPSADTTGEPSFQAPWSFSGLPVVSMPCGLGDDGLPVCLQFVGPAWQESPLLQTAAWCEKTVAFAARPSIV
jgi:aspartyl-tRNA(Asn)/glutamyl-tRNA(Gln) amidotransferase subunit A